MDCFHRHSLLAFVLNYLKHVPNYAAFFIRFLPIILISMCTGGTAPPNIASEWTSLTFPFPLTSFFLEVRELSKSVATEPITINVSHRSYNDGILSQRGTSPFSTNMSS